MVRGTFLHRTCLSVVSFVTKSPIEFYIDFRILIVWLYRSQRSRLRSRHMNSIRNEVKNEMNPITENNDEHDFLTYPKRFLTYKWYKPLLIALFTVVFAAIFAAMIYIPIIVINVVSSDSISPAISAAAGYDGMEVGTFTDAVTNFALIAGLIPSLALAAKIVKDRPFSSYSSSRGGWNWKIFFKCLGISLFVVGIPVAISNLLIGGDGVNRFTVAGFIALLVLCPLQCAAEEYIFRAFILQTIGSWFRIPALAIILSSVLFAACHPYNIVGVITVLYSGLLWCIMVRFTRGIEASVAAHIVNNMVFFCMMGWGMVTLSSATPLSDLIIGIIKDTLYFVVILWISRKYHWFDEVQADDVAAFNEKMGGKGVI